VTTYDPIERVRRARRQAATVAVLVAAGALLVVLVLGRLWVGRSGDPSAAAPTAPVVDDGGPDLRWAAFRPAQDLPESKSAGPSRRLDGRVAGFTRTQLGATLAAIHISHRIDPTVGPGIFEPTITEQVIGGEAARLREIVSKSYEDGRAKQGKGVGEPLDAGTARLAAYKVETYSPDTATVAVITAYEDRSQFFSYRLDLRWVEGDWHLVAPTGGDLNTTLTRLPALPPGAVALSKGS
jgi:hypothetical protein